MSDQCKIHGSCGSQGSHSHCSCCGSSKCTCSHAHCSSCGKEHGHEHHPDYARELLQMADDAWEELLMEKIKAHIEAATGKHLDKLAKLVAESNQERWKLKMGIQKTCDEYKDNLEDFFTKK